MQTFVNQGTVLVQTSKDEQVYESGGTMITHQQTSSTGSVQLISQDKQTEPDFMKYIKGVNIN